jgi:hypothetical protein
VPTSLTFVRELSPTVRAALGIFVTRAQDLSLQAQLTEQTDSGPTQWLLALSDTITIYHAGAAVGWAVLPEFRVGLSVLGVYAREELSFNLSGGNTAMDSLSDGFMTQTALANAAIFGFRIGGGFQWDVLPSLHLGFSVLSPSYQVGQQVSASSSVGAYVSTPQGSIGAFVPYAEDRIEAAFQLFAPPRLRMGIAFGDKINWISLDADLQPSLQNADDEVDRHLLVNARLGGRIEIVPGISMGAGLFTDFSPTSTPKEFGDTNITFLGGTLGLEYESAHQLAEREGESLTFSTTLAVRYAYGWGDVGGLQVPTFRPGDYEVTMPVVDVSIHEIGVHLGSALFF